MVGWWLVRGEKPTELICPIDWEFIPNGHSFFGDHHQLIGETGVASSLLVGPGSSPSSVMAKVKSFGDVQRFCPKSQGFFPAGTSFRCPMHQDFHPWTQLLEDWKPSLGWLGASPGNHKITQTYPNMWASTMDFFPLNHFRDLSNHNCSPITNSRVFSFTNHGYRTIGTTLW